ncbi:Phage integrase family protein [Pseudovibrio sp. Ad5]|uniref:tyrosine-type recombinase/integrase n=1 Tax=Pseudovibrio sp. Ad5 TaxID=989436 RepID=UPI0007AEA1BC|nr:tyrosine-type recombinase/integrase [Pseudovibrio sp. Ad5]KZK96420.1 Phage integrase family protein [Pseudovibrio sp. Ad5]
MTKVRLKGLSAYARNGRWYVYIRSNRKALVKGFEGSRDALQSHLSTPEILKRYTKLVDAPKDKGFGTLGGLIEYYQTKDRWTKLSPRTQSDYQRVIDWLREKNVLKAPLITVAPSDMAITRDKAAEDKYPKFSNDVLAMLSAAFSVGVEYGYAGLKLNPVRGISRKYKNSANANRRWKEAEFETIFEIIPKHLKPVLALARWTGARGQDIASLRWDNLQGSQAEGYSITYTAKKNKVDCLFYVLPPLQDVLNAEDKSTLTICKNSRGKPYPSENAMRKAWQDFKAKPVFKDTCPTGSDLTLHGLRVTYASDLKDHGFSDEDVAQAIGDKSTSMGKHYGRGKSVEKFASRVRRTLS